jgi:hypothetical protein
MEIPENAEEQRVRLIAHEQSVNRRRCAPAKIGIRNFRTTGSV